MNNNHWLERLQMFIARFNNAGIDADLPSLSLIELWGLYMHLNRLAES
jgi:hypothetical protein